MYYYYPFLGQLVLLRPRISAILLKEPVNLLRAKTRGSKIYIGHLFFEAKRASWQNGYNLTFLNPGRPLRVLPLLGDVWARVLMIQFSWDLLLPLC